MTDKNQTPEVPTPSTGSPAPADTGHSTPAMPDARAVVATGDPVMVETRKPASTETTPHVRPTGGAEAFAAARAKAGMGSTSDSGSASSGVSGAGVAGSGAAPPTHTSSAAAAMPPAVERPNFAWLAIALVLLCVALAAAVWWQRQAANQSGMAVAARLDTLTGELAQSRRDAREALALAQSHAGRVAALETAVRENQAEYSALEQAWQDFNDTTNDGVLANDVERLVTIASQQLRFGGSVSNAIVALEAAQSRLARADRPRFVPVQQAINGDLDRLRAVPQVDVAAQTARIDRLTALIGRAPLLVPDAQARPSAPPVAQPATQSAPEPAPSVQPADALPADAPWWQHWRAEIASWPARAGGALAHEMGDLIRVQRVDQPGALLLTGDQVGQLRGVLRQRLQTAQLALLMRQAPVWQSEISAVQQTLSDYFDPQSPDTQAATRLAESLASTQVVTSLPDLSNSLDAMAAARAEPTTETERN